MYFFNADTDLTAVCKRVAGFHITETAGAAAIVQLKDGGSSGQVVVDIRLPAVTGGNSIHFSDGQRPLLFNKGLYVDITGTVTGTIVPS